MADFELSDEDLAGFDKITSKPSDELVLSEEDLAGFDKAAPGMLESAGRGAIEGATFGFGDELAGLQKAATGEDMSLTTFLPGVAVAKATKNLGGKLYDVATTDKTVSDLLKELKDTYTSKRDEVRADNKIAQEANPWSYGIGDVGASIATGIATGGAGLVGKGLSAAGLKLAAKEGGKELLEQGVKRGGLGALTTIGATEGALHGMGRSEADLTQGEVGEFAQDTAIGGAIGGAIGALAPAALKGTGKVIKGTASLADDIATKVPVVGDVYTHLKDVGREGVENMGLSFKQAANKALGKISQSADDIKAQGLLQEEKYAKDLAEAQVSSNKGLYDATSNWKKSLQKGKELVGNEINTQDNLIDDALRYHVDNIDLKGGKIFINKFDFKDIAPEVDEVSRIIGKGNALTKTFEQMQQGNYSNVSEQMKQLNRIIEASDVDEKHLLKNLKNRLQQRIDETMQNLPDGEAKNLYRKRMDLNKDYSLLASLQEDMGAGFGDPVGKLQTKMSLAANPQSGGGDSLEFFNQLRKGYQSGNRDIIQSTDDAIARAQKYNKFNVMNPEKGSMFSDQMVPKNIQKVDDYFMPTNQMDLEDIALTWKSGSKGYDPTKQLPSGQYYHDKYSLDKLLPYKEFDRPVDQNLVNSLKQTGFKDPVVVQVAKDGSLKVAEGNHRLMAAKTLGMNDVPVKFEFVRESVGSPVSKMELGPIGRNEQLSQQFDEVFGKPKDFGVSSSFAKTIEELNDSARGIGQSSKRDNLVSWIKSTYGDKADDVIAGLQKDSKSFQTLKEGLDKNVRAGQDVSSIIRAVKKMADPIAYGAAQFGSTVSKKIPNVSQANSLRALTQPQLYKDVVKGFKESQQQGDVDPNDVE